MKFIRNLRNDLKIFLDSLATTYNGMYFKVNENTSHEIYLHALEVKGKDYIWVSETGEENKEIKESPYLSISDFLFDDWSSSLIVNCNTVYGIQYKLTFDEVMKCTLFEDLDTAKLYYELKD